MYGFSMVFLGLGRARVGGDFLGFWILEFFVYIIWVFYRGNCVIGVYFIRFGGGRGC